MDNLLMIATLIEKLPHGDLKSMADLLCTQIKEGTKGINWGTDQGAMIDLIYDWAICQIEAAADEKSGD